MNKTWSEVSRISPTELNKMECKFLLGVNLRLSIDKQTYDLWFNLLRGLVYAKESKARRWQDLLSANGTRVVRQRAHQYHQECPVQDGHQYPYQHQNQDEQPYGDSAYLSNISGATRATRRVEHARSESSTATRHRWDGNEQGPAVHRSIRVIECVCVHILCT